MKVSLLYNRMTHHAAASGYDQIARYLAERVAVERVEPYMPRMIPQGVWTWLADRSGVEWYDRYSAGLEAGAALRLLRARNETCHVLYGEDSYRYLGAVRRLVRGNGNRLVCTYHQPPAIFDRVVRCKREIERLDAVVAVASNQAAHFASFVPESRVFFVRHGIDTDYYRPSEHKESDGKECLFVGLWLRDFEMLRAVIEGVGARDQRVRFKVVTSPEKAALLDGLSNVVALSGISDLALLQAYQQADTLVLPLMDCTANNALLEGLACGLPVVTTDVGGVRDYVDTGCAFLVRTGGVASMCEAILELTANARLRAEMSRRSRQRALSCDWRRVAEQLIDVYRGVAA
jgi:glycosyltransferase involved in cell wall biosynthesis